MGYSSTVLFYSYIYALTLHSVIVMNESHRIVFKKDSSKTASTNDNNVEISSFKWPPFPEGDFSGTVSTVIDLSKTPDAHKCLTTLKLQVDNGVNKTLLHFNESNVFIRNDGDMRSIAHSIQLPKFPIVIYFDETCVDVKLDGRKYPLTTKTGYRSEVTCTLRGSLDCHRSKVDPQYDYIDFRKRKKLRVDDMLSQTFRMALVVLFPIAVIAMIPTVALVWVEAIEKRRYQLAKDKPVKLKLTREYLAKVRPPKKVIKHSTANEAAAAKDAK